MSLLDKASLIVTPNAYKESKLYSVIPSSGAGDMNVVRATTATRVNSSGLIEVVPRNLFTYSQQFDNADWEKDGVTVTANTTTAPNGTTTADKINETTATSSHLVRNLFTGTGTTTISVFAKKAERDYIVIYSSGGSLGAYFDLNTGTALGIIGSCTSNIQSVGNGWYRCSITFSLTGLAYAFIGASSLGNNVSYTGIAGYGVYLWGAQSESFGSTTEYFPTTTRLNIPRIDYTNGSCPSLLLEPQRTNIALYSEQFDNAYWTKQATTITANNTTSPDGTINADKIISNAVNDEHLVYYFEPTLLNQVLTVSLFVKKLNYRYAILRSFTTGAYRTSVFDLDNGTITSQDLGASTIKNYGNGWYRISTTFTSPLGTFGIQYGFSATTGFTYNGDGASANYAWGFQTELGSYPTSYIPTVASTVTRNADVISKTGISGVIGQTEGTIFIDFVYTESDQNGLIPITIGSNSSNHSYMYIEGNNRITFDFIVAGSDVLSIQTAIGFAVKGTRYKIALAYKANNFAAYINGVLIGTQNSGAIIGFNDFYFGYPFASGYSYPLKINSSQLYKTRLTNAELAQLTTL